MQRWRYKGVYERARNVISFIDKLMINYRVIDNTQLNCWKLLSGFIINHYAPFELGKFKHNLETPEKTEKLIWWKS